MKNYLRVHDVAEKLKVSTSTVRNYVQKGDLECDYTPTGQRVFTQEQVDAFLGKEPKDRIVFYVRSSNGNQSLMTAQIQELTEAYGEPLKVFKDKGSGLNENRKGLQALFNGAEQQEFNKVCITHADRLSRFGFSFIERMLNKDNVKIVVLNKKNSPSLEEELLQDFMNLVASFSGRFYRMRSKESQRRLLKKAESELDHE